MGRNRKSPLAGGILILGGFLAGAVVGVLRGDASRWTLAGVVIGVILSLILWALDRRRAP